MARCAQIRVEYHPEFLYFNDTIRRCGFTPSEEPELWRNDDREQLSLFEVFDWVLRCVRLSKGSKPIRRLIESWNIHRVDSSLDVEPWLGFAKSFDVERLAARYAQEIFGLFGTSFQLPPIILGPMRLTACQKQLFEKLRDGRYGYEHILRADPAHYNPTDHLIYLPTPETRSSVPTGLFDELIVHEILHVPTRIWNLREVRAGDRLLMLRLPANAWMQRIFGELFCN